MVSVCVCVFFYSDLYCVFYFSIIIKIFNKILAQILTNYIYFGIFIYIIKSEPLDTHSWLIVLLIFSLLLLIFK